MRTRKGFTLVELIITIAIIAVLAVTAIVMITKWISKSRDSARLQDIAVIQQGLETEIVNTKIYPMPDNFFNVYDTGGALAWYQGEFTDNVKGYIITLNKTPKDPQGKNYGYSLSNDKKQYQLRAFLENTSYNFNYTNTANAATQISKINGNYNGFLVTRQSYSTGNVYSLWNIPTLFLWSGTVFTSGTNYVNENNKPVDNTTNLAVANVTGLYDTNSTNDSSTLDGVVSTFSGTNSVNTAQLAQLTMKTAAGGLSLLAASGGGSSCSAGYAITINGTSCPTGFQLYKSYTVRYSISGIGGDSCSSGCGGGCYAVGSVNTTYSICYIGTITNYLSRCFYDGWTVPSCNPTCESGYTAGVTFTETLGSVGGRSCWAPIIKKSLLCTKN